MALVQAHLIWGDVKSNLWAFDKRVPLCKGADVIVFPELFTSGCEMKKRDKEEAMRSKDEVASYYPDSDQADEEMGEALRGIGDRFHDLQREWEIL